MSHIDLRSRGSGSGGGGGITQEGDPIWAANRDNYVLKTVYEKALLNTPAAIDIEDLPMDLQWLTINLGDSKLEVKAVFIKDQDGNDITVDKTFSAGGVELNRQAGNFMGNSIYVILKRLAS